MPLRFRGGLETRALTAFVFQSPGWGPLSSPGVLPGDAVIASRPVIVVYTLDDAQGDTPADAERIDSPVNATQAEALPPLEDDPVSTQRKW